MGWQEIMIILVIALIVFGPRKLPQLGRTLGKALGEFRRATNDLRNTLELEVHKEEEKVNSGERRRAEEDYSRRAAEEGRSERGSDAEAPAAEDTPDEPPVAADDDADAVESPPEDTNRQ